MAELKNFKTHLYYYLENEEGLRLDLSLLREAGAKLLFKKNSTTVPKLEVGDFREVPVHEIRVTGEVNGDLTEKLHNDDDDASWEG